MPDDQHEAVFLQYQSLSPLLSPFIHGLRNKLNALAGSGEMLETFVEDERLKRYASLLRSSAAELREGIEALVSILRAGEAQDGSKDLTAGQVLAQVLSLQKIVSPGEADWQTEIDPRLSEVPCPGSALGWQVFLLSLLVSSESEGRTALEKLTVSFQGKDLLLVSLDSFPELKEEAAIMELCRGKRVPERGRWELRLN
jgi:nitrogen-specific signal transduction histidine kinase